LHATISVEKTGPGDIALLVNGKADATSRGDAVTQMMVAHLPMLLHPDPQDILLIGLGSGMTLGAVEMHPMKSIDIVEIEPAIVEASEYFRSFTNDALDDPRVNLLITDGRNHVTFTDRQYDVIINEPSNPWVSGMANLFTREFFALAKERLREGGVMCQWLHAYSMSSDDFRTVVATFQTVFPRMNLWEVDMAGDYILLGFPDGLDIQYEVLRSRLSAANLSGDMKTMNIRDVASLLARVVLDEQAAAEYAKGGLLHTDGNARLEYSAPIAFVEAERLDLLDDLYQHRSQPHDVLRAFSWGESASELDDRLPILHEARKEVFAGYLHVLDEKGPQAVARLEQALSLNPKDVEAVDLLHDIYFETGNRYKEADRLEEAKESYLKSVQIISDFFDGDQDMLGRQFDLNVGYSDALIRLGLMYLDANELQAAEKAFQDSLQGYVEYPESYNNLGAVYDRAGKYDEAVKAYQRALEMKPGYVAAIINLANVRLKQGHFEEAIKNYHQAQMLRPNYEMTHYNLGVAYYQQGEWAMAAAEWRRALQLRPNFPEARKSLDAVKKKITFQQ
jgi:spermidine synthase